MLRSHRQNARPLSGARPTAPLRRPGARGTGAAAGAANGTAPGLHPLTCAEENTGLAEYEQQVKAAFDAVVPALKQVSALQHETDFEQRAQAIARDRLGFALPADMLADAWVDQLDMRRLYAWCVFETYLRYCDDFFVNDPLGSGEEEFELYLQDCGFHTLDLSPCADGRLAHVIRYVLRLPYRAVRRKSYAGAMFDIEDSLAKWTETEFLRYREGRPNGAEEPTRYLKAVVYHYSSVAGDREGCAAHGSDAGRAAQAGLDRLLGFQRAVQNSFCCGASIDLLLIGLDTATDAIRVHVPDGDGEIELARFVGADRIYEQTRHMDMAQAKDHVMEQVRAVAAAVPDGMARFVTRLLLNNLSQIDYVRASHGAHYPDIGHAERFIGAGIGFEEVQLRNLTYFAYLDTVEEAAPDLDVGVKIFTGLNVGHGLPIPVVVRYDYHGQVPGARERAIAHCERVDTALHERYARLSSDGLLHTLQVVRDCNAGARIEILDCSAKPHAAQEAH